MSRTHRRETGFSLLELLAVLALILAASMIALPSLLDARENYRLTAVTGQLVGDLHRARIWAITKDAQLQISVVDSDTYSIDQDVSGTWTNLEYGLDLPSGFTLASTDPGGFGPYGNGDAGTYTITNPNGRTRQVAVELSGRIHAD